MRYVDLGNAVENYREKEHKKEQVKSTAGRRRVFKYLAVILVAVVLGILTFVFRKNLLAIFNPISIVSSIARSDLKETDGRTNILFLGSDKRGVGSAIESELTDTILVASIGRVDGSVVLISLPRDLWVKSPKGYLAKINSIYAYGGAGEISAVAQDVLGIPIHYYAVVGFDLFSDAVNILGGIEVDIEHSFDDNFYPVEGKENSPLSERYETVHFDAGLQIMDGEMALKYIRSRKGNNGEGTDFARAHRQQKAIMALKGKMLSLETLIDLPKLKELYNLYSKGVDTSIDFNALQNFYLLSKQIEFDNVRMIVLDDRSAADEGGLLYAPEDNSLYGGAYVLIPRAGDFSQLHAYVQRYVFGE